MAHGTNRHQVQGTSAGVDKTVDGQGDGRQGKQNGELQGQLCLLLQCYHYSNLCEFKMLLHCQSARELEEPIRFPKIAT